MRAVILACVRVGLGGAGSPCAGVRAGHAVAAVWPPARRVTCHVRTARCAGSRSLKARLPCGREGEATEAARGAATAPGCCARGEQGS